jgi:TctA family transporter
MRPLQRTGLSALAVGAVALALAVRPFVRLTEGRAAEDWSFPWHFWLLAAVVVAMLGSIKSSRSAAAALAIYAGASALGGRVWVERYHDSERWIGIDDGLVALLAAAVSLCALAAIPSREEKSR